MYHFPKQSGTRRRPVPPRPPDPGVERRQMAVTQEEFLDAHAASMLSSCTACGKCIEVCPTREYNASKDEDPEAVARGILSILRSSEPSAAARIFIESCCGSARCRDVCPEGIDAYDMMRVAKVRLAKQ